MIQDGKREMQVSVKVEKSGKFKVNSCLHPFLSIKRSIRASGLTKTWDLLVDIFSSAVWLFINI